MATRPPAPPCTSSSSAWTSPPRKNPSSMMYTMSIVRTYVSHQASSQSAGATPTLAKPRLKLQLFSGHRDLPAAGRAVGHYAASRYSELSELIHTTPKLHNLTPSSSRQAHQSLVPRRHKQSESVLWVQDLASRMLFWLHARVGIKLWRLTSRSAARSTRSIRLPMRQVQCFPPGIQY
jgi:hypothetical protein